MNSDQNNRKAVVLLSGGLDSATVLAIATEMNFDIYAISFDYGQRNKHELNAARKLAKYVLEHLILKVDLRPIGGSALTADISVPVNRQESKIGKGVPVTYVPARNTIFLSLALAWAETLDAKDIFIGVNAVDCSGYPDCRPEFIDAFENLANIATRTGVEDADRIYIRTPLLRMSKREIILKGLELGVDYSITSTCYSPFDNGNACGKCDACTLRLKGFSEAGIPDPVVYGEHV